MKNWKKIMAMLCTAAMVTGFSAPVWAEADAAEDTETADDEITELTMKQALNLLHLVFLTLTYLSGKTLP